MKDSLEVITPRGAFLTLKTPYACPSLLKQEG